MLPANSAPVSALLLSRSQTAGLTSPSRASSNLKESPHLHELPEAATTVERRSASAPASLFLVFYLNLSFHQSSIIPTFFAVPIPFHKAYCQTPLPSPPRKASATQHNSGLTNCAQTTNRPIPDPTVRQRLLCGKKNRIRRSLLNTKSAAQTLRNAIRSLRRL